MSVQTGLIIAILLGLLGVFFSIRAGVHFIQVSRRQASWPERRKQMVASQRYFGLALILLVVVAAGMYMIFTGNVPHLIFPASPTASLEWTATNLPSEIPTNTPSLTSTPGPTDTPSLTFTPSQTYTISPVPSQTSRPTETHWPTWTPSQTPTHTSTPRPTRTPTITSTTLPTRTPRPTDTRWPTLTPTGIK